MQDIYRVIKITAIYSKWYLVLLLLFLSISSVTSFINTSLLNPAIGRSIITLNSEGQYPSYGLPFRKITLDNFTDAIMLNTAYSGNSDSPVSTALFNSRKLLDVNEINQISNLESNYLGKSTTVSSYERYWHGYLILLKPALVLFSYSNIRVALTIISISLFTLLLYWTWKKVALIRSVALLIAALYTDFFYVGQSLQFSQVYLLGIVASLWYLKNKEKLNNTYALFYIIGGLTSYFDLLTAPLITLGFLLIVTTQQDYVSYTYKNILSWGIGYSSLWMSKWIILELFFASGSFSNAFGHVVNRTINQADSNFSYIKTLQINVQQLIGYDSSNKYFALILAFIILLVFIFFKKINMKRLKKASAWGMQLTIPYIWYLLVANHSYIHVWFTYRAQFLSVAAFVLLFNEFIDWKKVSLFLKLATKSSKK